MPNQDFMIEAFGLPDPWMIGDVIKGGEPHNREQTSISRSNTGHIFMGRLVKMVKDANFIESIAILGAGSVETDIFGFSLSGNPFQMVETNGIRKRAYTAHYPIVPVAMIDCPLCIAADYVMQTSLIDPTTAPLFAVVTDDENSAGMIYIGDTPPTVAGTAYLSLSADKFSIRKRPLYEDNRGYYLCVKAGYIPTPPAPTPPGPSNISTTKSKGD